MPWDETLVNIHKAVFFDGPSPSRTPTPRPLPVPITIAPVGVVNEGPAVIDIPVDVVDSDIPVGVVVSSIGGIPLAEDDAAVVDEVAFRTEKPVK